MGVVNVTADSFSDGGRYLNHDAAIAHGLALYADGADIIDIGGESTRPGAQRVDEDAERDRVIPVVAALAARGVPTSVDTMRSAVADGALQAGASMINDVSGGLADAQMTTVAAEHDVPICLMHWRAHSATMQQFTAYDDVVSDVIDELSQRIDAARAAGVQDRQIVLDPGLGFAKTASHNWQLLQSTRRFVELGFPILIGASRKSFLGSLLAEEGDQPRPPDGREDATTAISALAALAGAWAVRTHQVRASADAVRVAASWRDGKDFRHE